jgi:hypothetical protein
MFRFVSILFATILWATAALADGEKPWTVDMTTVIVVDGKPVPNQFLREKDDPACDKCAPLTLGEATYRALCVGGGNDREANWEQKWAWCKLGERMRYDARAMPTAAETKQIADHIGAMYGPLVIIVAMPLIDPNRKPPEIK